MSTPAPTLDSAGLAPVAVPAPAGRPSRLPGEARARARGFAEVLGRRAPGREVWLTAALACAVATVLAVLGPPGVDSAAHRYQTYLFSSEGWRFWNNYWYAGRYELVNYSLLYYPLAARLGVLAVAVMSVAAGAGLFTALVVRQWGRAAVWPARLFAVSSAALLVAGQYPFALGAALALVALVCAQRSRSLLVVLAALGCLLASPLAFLFLVATLAGVALAHRDSGLLGTARVVVPLLAIGLFGVAEAFVVRAFPTGGAFPYPVLDLLGVTAFSLCGLAFAWGNERTRVLGGLFIAYLVLGWAAYLFPSALGGNAARLLDWGAAPLLALVIAVRGGRPRALAALALCVAVSWQAVPFLRNVVDGYTERANAATFWRPALGFFADASHRDPNYRVEVVATWGHWESYYLGRQGIPLARGWFRQDDFPQNRIFYRQALTAASYRTWLRQLGVRYVLLPHDELDPSARAEGALLRAPGHAGLRLIESSPSGNWRIFELPDATPIVTAVAVADPAVASQAEVVRMTSDGMTIWAPSAGVYRVRLRYTPYWRVDAPATACVERGPNWQTQLRVARPGPVRIQFGITLSNAASTAVGSSTSCALPPFVPAG